MADEKEILENWDPIVTTKRFRIQVEGAPQQKRKHAARSIWPRIVIVEWRHIPGENDGDWQYVIASVIGPEVTKDGGRSGSFERQEDFYQLDDLQKYGSTWLVRLVERTMPRGQ